MFYKVNYHSDMSGSPVVSGTVGAGIVWIDAMLLNGFNEKSVSSLSRTDTTATVTTSTAHGMLPGEIVGFYGIVEANWNGLYQILTVPDSTSFTFTVSDTLSASTTGTITVKYPPAGSYLSSGNLTTYWTKVLSETNKAIYRSLDPLGTQWYLRVDDTTTTYMTVSMLEGYTSIDSGLLNQQNVYWVKSSTANATVRNWNFVGDSKRFYCSVCWSAWFNDNGYPTSHDWYFFGDIISDVPGDAYHCGIIGNINTTHVIGTSYESGASSRISFNFSNSSSTGAYLMRKFNQVGPQINFGRWGAIQYSQCIGHSAGFAYPNFSNFGTYIDQQLLAIESSSIRGRMPGMHIPMNNTAHSFATRDTSVIINDHQFMYFRLYVYNSYIGGFFLDVTPDLDWGV